MEGFLRRDNYFDFNHRKQKEKEEEIIVIVIVKSSVFYVHLTSS